MSIERVGVVGLGYIATFHSAALRRLPSQPEIIGFEPDERASGSALRQGLVDRVVGSLDELLAAAPEAVHVLTPPDTHADIAVRVLSHGIDVLLEKPLAHTREAAARIAVAAEAHGAAVGVSHNLLFAPEWIRARSLLDGGAIGRLCAVEVTTRRPVPALRSEDVRTWMTRGSANVLFEIAPHAFAQVLDLVPSVDVDAVVTGDVQQLPTGVGFVRSWEVIGSSGDVRVRVSLSFGDSMATSTVVLRGTLGEIQVDLDRSTVATVTRGVASYDLEVCRQSLQQSAALTVGALRRMTTMVAAKGGIGSATDPFSAGIDASVETFHGRDGRLVDDARQSLGIGTAVVDLAATVAERAALELDDSPPTMPGATPRTVPSGGRGEPEVVVLGGTGFIGRQVVRRLAEQRPVRVVARRAGAAEQLFDGMPVEVVPADVTDTDAVLAAIADDMTVIDLTFSGSSTWDALSEMDLAPVVRLTEALAERRLRRYVYSSTIAVYDAGRPGEVITERTPLGASTIRVAPYPRLKAAVEQHLETLHRTLGFPVVVARPGVVLGVDSDPCHWGVAAWPYSNVCVHWGSGRHRLPLVLVEDVADAFVGMVDVDGIEGHSFNLCADPGITAADYVETLARATGEPIRAIARSTLRWHAIALATWAVKLPGQGRVPTPSRRELAGRGFAARFDCSKAQTLLGWSPEQRRAEVLRRGVAEPAKAWQR